MSRPTSLLLFRPPRVIMWDGPTRTVRWLLVALLGTNLVIAVAAGAAALWLLATSF